MIKIKTKLREFDKYRKNKMRNLEHYLYRLLNNRRYCQSKLLNTDDVKKVLIIRNNKRIGNIYFMIPFVKHVRDVYPHAELTLMLNQPWQGEIFKNMGVNHIVYSHFSFKQILNTLKLIFKMRTSIFDLIFIPNSSAGDTCLCAMLSARNKISVENSQRNIAFTHTYVKHDELHHMALSNLFILKQMMGGEEVRWDHTLNFSKKEIISGEDAYRKMNPNTAFSIAYFRGARGDKRLSHDVWLDLLKQFEQATQYPIQWIEILSPDIQTPIRDDVNTFLSSDMRHLASFLKNVNGFICCDTGPLHLADAANVNSIGIFTKTDPAVFGLLSENSQIIQNLEYLNCNALLQKAYLSFESTQKITDEPLMI